MPRVSFPRGLAVDGFDNQVAVNTASPTLVEGWHDAARVVAAAAVAELPRLADCPERDAACGRAFVQGFAARAWRRPITADERAELAEAFDGWFAAVWTGKTRSMRLSTHFSGARPWHFGQCRFRQELYD